MRGLMILLLLVGLVALGSQKIDFENLKKNLKFGDQIEQIEQVDEAISSLKLRHIKEKKRDEDDKTFHQIPPGCKDTEGRVLIPLRAECR